jgi:hypothetical protein
MGGQTHQNNSTFLRRNLKSKNGMEYGISSNETISIQQSWIQFITEGEIKTFHDKQIKVNITMKTWE